MKAYSVRDSKTSVYFVPFFAHDDNHAERIVFDASLDEKTQFHQYPEDFTLFAAGEFDSECCHFVNESPGLRCVGSFLDIIHRQAQRRFTVKDVLDRHEVK